VKSSFPEHLRLDRMRIVVDCANGAAYSVAPQALWELGAEVIAIGVSPDGTNVNDRCGSTAPEALQAKVLETRADIGIALDGDADRLIIVDERGKIVDGDQIMALLAASWQRRGLLKGGGIVATVMSNLGLERYLAGEGLNLHRTKVGDRYVLEAMRAHGFNVGGEQSGHLILADYATTGDGLMAALQVLAELVHTGRPASELLRRFDPLPQRLQNVRFKSGAPLETEGVRASIAAAEARLAGTGRLVIRKSGTEPLIRVMAEGEDPALVREVVEEVCEAVRRAA
jgi:phosphoglucosamine mutase